jgi:hypothetical protein
MRTVAFAVAPMPRPLDGLRRSMLHVAAIAVAASLVLAVAVAVVQPRDVPPSASPPSSWLATTPDIRAAIGPVELDGSVAGVIARLGDPDEIVPDIGGQARVWSLAGGATQSVTTPTGALSPVVGIDAVVPAGSPMRFGLHGDLLLGAASVTDVVRAWGPPERFGGQGDDYAVQYVECRGAFPVVLKVQPTRVLVAYADEPPGSAPCGAPS